MRAFSVDVNEFHSIYRRDKTKLLKPTNEQTWKPRSTMAVMRNLCSQLFLMLTSVGMTETPQEHLSSWHLDFNQPRKAHFSYTRKFRGTWRWQTSSERFKIRSPIWLWTHRNCEKIWTAPPPVLSDENSRVPRIMVLKEVMETWYSTKKWSQMKTDIRY